MHTHEVDKIDGVLAGRFEMEMEGSAVVLEAGDLLWVPRRTPHSARVIASHKISEGSALVFVSGSTAGLTTIEFEPGLQRDFPEFFEKLAPQGAHYHHEDTWHDGNGHSHVRASLLGPSLTVPFAKKKLLLGTWQQIVLLDFDNRPRERKVLVQLQGE